MRNSIFVIVLSLLAAPLVFAGGKAQPILDGIVTVENDKSLWLSKTVATVEHRPESSIYVVRGRVQYRDVEGIAYLEMWNILPDGNRFFSRTLGEYGTMQSIRGTSGWREFELPANLMHLKPESVTLEINVVMPGKGTIELSGLTVSDVQTSVPGEWFNSRTGGIIGGLAGTAIGLYGALIGCLGAFLSPRGKGRRLLTGMLVFAVVVGLVLLLIGISALVLGQSFHVWYPFAFGGGILVTVFLPLFFVIKKAYEQVERRRMQALDL